jgi:hypothetical protein
MKKRVLMILMVLLLVASIGLAAFACRPKPGPTPTPDPDPPAASHLGFYQFLMLAVESLDNTIAMGTSGDDISGKATIEFMLNIDSEDDDGLNLAVGVEINAKGLFRETGNSEAFLQIRAGNLAEGQLALPAAEGNSDTWLMIYATNSTVYIGQRFLEPTLNWARYDQGATQTRALAQLFANIPAWLNGLAPEEDSSGVTRGVLENLLFTGDTLPGVMDILSRLGDNLLTPATSNNTTAPAGFVRGTGPGSLRGAVTPAGRYTFSFPFAAVGQLLTDLGGAIDGLTDFINEMLEDSAIIDIVAQLLFNNPLEAVLKPTDANNDPPELTLILDVGNNKTFESLAIEFINDDAVLAIDDTELFAGKIGLRIALTDVEITKAPAATGNFELLKYTGRTQQEMVGTLPAAINLRMWLDMPQMNGSNGVEKGLSAELNMWVFPDFVINFANDAFSQDFEKAFAAATLDITDNSGLFSNIGDIATLEGALFFVACICDCVCSDDPCTCPCDGSCGRGFGRVAFDLAPLFGHTGGAPDPNMVYFYDVPIDSIFSFFEGSEGGNGGNGGNGGGGFTRPDVTPRAGNLVDEIVTIIFDIIDGDAGPMDIVGMIPAILGMAGNIGDVLSELPDALGLVNISAFIQALADLSYIKESNFAKDFILGDVVNDKGEVVTADLIMFLLDLFNITEFDGADLDNPEDILEILTKFTGFEFGDTLADLANLEKIVVGGFVWRGGEYFGFDSENREGRGGVGAGFIVAIQEGATLTVLVELAIGLNIAGTARNVGMSETNATAIRTRFEGMDVDNMTRLTLDRDCDGDCCDHICDAACGGPSDCKYVCDCDCDCDFVIGLFDVLGLIFNQFFQVALFD